MHDVRCLHRKQRANLGDRKAPTFERLSIGGCHAEGEAVGHQAAFLVVVAEGRRLRFVNPSRPRSEAM